MAEEESICTEKVLANDGAISVRLHRHMCVCTYWHKHTGSEGPTPADGESFHQEDPAQVGNRRYRQLRPPLLLTDVNRRHVILPDAWLSSPLTQQRDADAGPAPLSTLHQISIHPALAPKQNKRPCGQSIVVRPGRPSITTAFRYTK